MSSLKTSRVLIVLALVVCLVILALAVGRWALEEIFEPATAAWPAADPSTAAAEAHEAFLYGRITTEDSTTYEGRLRWGGVEEAFWGDYFNGFKDENPWQSHVPPERLKEHHPVEVFGLKIAQQERQFDLRRPFMARFGDIARIEAHGRDLQVTLKNRTVIDLDRYSMDDLADGVRVWDVSRGVMNLDERRIRAIELLPAPSREGAVALDRLHGTVRARQGKFTGFVQWNREACVGWDKLNGHTDDKELSLRFDTLRSIARNSHDSSLVTLLDGREIILSGTREAGQDNRGVYVDDRRYGRVLVSWDAFERLDFSAANSDSGGGPTYSDFPPGQALTGTVTSRGGSRLAGRLVFDLDESESTETLDAPSKGVDYTIPFGLIASIKLAGSEDRGVPSATVMLHSGEELRLERTGDLGDENAGMLIFIDGRERPEYVPWTDVERIDVDRPSAMYPTLE